MLPFYFCLHGCTKGTESCSMLSSMRWNINIMYEIMPSDVHIGPNYDKKYEILLNCIKIILSQLFVFNNMEE